MRKTWYWAGIVTSVIALMGCSSSEFENYQLFPDEYVYDVEYDSIYHYGYNQGCESALNVLRVADMDYRKDTTLDNSDTRFNEGWGDGNQACQSVRMIMPTSKIMPSQPIRPAYAAEYAEGY
ncbi:hypothetical protein C9I98_07485 [Photobacterium sanctipauli]|uniref:DUF2799 domain-containing protein n=1 Tax=Photobacterium sanctipauli TaxID=1342794 RepID=A0A2T3NWL3_9GAMM|nr:hypothetical protein [Photobacterium sanctipauli]PSW20680.1 hypothetical protein C9I98_07485 [Photobacterium sanctipauli]